MKKILLILFLGITTVLVAKPKFQESTLISIQNDSIKNLRAYPNPFVSETKISFTSNTTARAILKVKNLLGKTVFIKEFTITKGKNNITFYKNNLESGMYIYSLQTESEIVSKRLVIK